MHGGRLRPVALSLLVVVASLVAGCLNGGGGAMGPGDDKVVPFGQHPYPDRVFNADGTYSSPHWPMDLKPPFKLKEILELHVPMLDGTNLFTWVILPDVPDGVKVPAVLKGSPYYGQNVHDFAGQTGEDPGYWDNSEPREAVPINLLIENGYAVVLEAVRGTSRSGGCFDFFGPLEQADQVAMVEWIAKQPWSNGRVAMMGLSYHGTTPVEAAIHNPEPLKTIVISGLVTDVYSWITTPQGAVHGVIGPFIDSYFFDVSFSPPVSSQTKGPQWGIEAYLENGADRWCPEVAQMMEELSTQHLADARNEAFARDRAFLAQFPAVTAAVFVGHGFSDGNQASGHALDEMWVWNSLPDTPKRQVEGQQGHSFPNIDNSHPEWEVEDWNLRVLEWFDFWLKGLGDEPPGEGLMDYLDGQGMWHTSTAWPPAEAHNEVLYLSWEGERELTGVPPPAGASTFTSAPPATADAALCPTGAPTAWSYLSPPVDKPTLVAGNPIAYLNLESDTAGGLVGVTLYDLGPGFACSNGQAQDARLLVEGAADLRFYQGNFQAIPFPVATPTPVRIDMNNLAETLEMGHRLAAVVHYPTLYVGAGHAPRLSVLADGTPQSSHFVIPIVDGTLGGGAPSIEYPPHPFLSPLVDSSPS